MLKKGKKIIKDVETPKKGSLNLISGISFKTFLPNVATNV